MRLMTFQGDKINFRNACGASANGKTKNLALAELPQMAKQKKLALAELPQTIKQKY